MHDKKIEPISFDAFGIAVVILTWLFGPRFGWAREGLLLLAAYLVASRFDTWMLFWLGKQ